MLNGREGNLTDINQKIVVHLSTVSLNSLAEILHQANPLYNECRSILNRFDACEGKGGHGRSDLREPACALGAELVDLCQADRTETVECS